MNLRSCSLLLTALAAGASAAAATGADALRFSLVSPEYKQPVPVPATFFNPFKIQAIADAETSRRDTPSVSNDAVVVALSHRGLSGLLYAAQGGHNRVIIGDDIFSVGDELTFSGGPDGTLPLVAGAAVVLRSLDSDKITLEVTPTGEAARTITYPLRAFWRP